jgi:hypothetical protein
VTAAEEIGIAPTFGALVAVRRLLGKRNPCGRVVALHLGSEPGDRLPHLIPRLTAEIEIEHPWKYEDAIPLEPGDLAFGEGCNLMQVGRGMAMEWLLMKRRLRGIAVSKCLASPGGSSRDASRPRFWAGSVRGGRLTRLDPLPTEPLPGDAPTHIFITRSPTPRPTMSTSEYRSSITKPVVITIQESGQDLAARTRAA